MKKLNSSFLMIVTFIMSLMTSSYGSCEPGKIPGKKPGPGILKFGDNQILTDIRKAGWEYFVAGDGGRSSAGSMFQSGTEPDLNKIKAEMESVMPLKTWKPIHLGRRWDIMGYPDLNDKDVWVRIRFFVPMEMKDYKLGFFCTSVDDAALFFLNDDYLDKKSYVIGARIPEPVVLDLTPKIHFGGENLFAIRLSDFAPARGGGILGHVFLFRSLPFTRTPNGGISLTTQTAGRYSVLLHLGDALLSKDQKTSFTPEELHSMKIPPYILREDELVLVCPEEEMKQIAPPYRVELDKVSPVTDSRKLSVQCDKLPVSVEQYDLIKLPVQLSATYLNPFDPKQISVQALVETPSGKTERVPAFFQQDFTAIAIGSEEEILLPKAGNPWCVYYRPRETGSHQFHVIAQDVNGISRTPAQKFDVKKSDKRGFLRVSKEDPRFFEFENGESYFGIGPSGWSRDTNYTFGGNPRWISTRLLDDYYRKKADAGSNFDYCLAEFFGRLYTKGGFIDQHVAWKCEHRVRTLEELGIYWVTCYDDLCRSTVYGLNTLPYSEAQGGPCKTIPELYFNERSLEMQREHLRYFVARMSDSPALLVWAIGDEGQSGNSFSRPMVRSWISELHKYVRTIDIYQHPHVMGEGPTSVPDGGDAIIIPDWYFNPGLKDDGVALVQEIMKKYNGFNVPLINPEGGMVQWTKPEDAYGPKKAGYYLSGERWKFPEAISYHNNLWISLFNKNAVGGTEWLGHFIVKRDQLFHATALRNFLEGESLTKPHWEIVTPETAHPDLRAFCLQSAGKSWAWVQNRFYTWVEAGHYGRKPPVVTGAEINIPVKREGKYRIELWDTRSGKIISTVEAVSKKGKVNYGLPPVEKDVALKAIFTE